jgi:hypothetical protein
MIANIFHLEILRAAPPPEPRNPVVEEYDECLQRNQNQHVSSIVLYGTIFLVLALLNPNINNLCNNNLFQSLDFSF